MTNSGFVVVNAAYNNGHDGFVLLAFQSLILLLYVAAIFIAVHMKAMEGQREGKFLFSVTLISRVADTNN